MLLILPRAILVIRTQDGRENHVFPYAQHGMFGSDYCSPVYSYRSGRKYKVRLVLMLMCKRALFLRPFLVYVLSTLISGTRLALVLEWNSCCLDQPVRTDVYTTVCIPANTGSHYFGVVSSPNKRECGTWFRDFCS